MEFVLLRFGYIMHRIKECFSMSLSYIRAYFPWNPASSYGFEAPFTLNSSARLAAHFSMSFIQVF